jgi:hypothetical protein
LQGKPLKNMGFPLDRREFEIKSGKISRVNALASKQPKPSSLGLEAAEMPARHATKIAFSPREMRC